MPTTPLRDQPDGPRRRAMAAFARATRDELAGGLDRLGLALTATDLRPAESGLVMVRGRMGGTGDAFNLGEAMVSRASVRIASGTLGHAYRLGRDVEAARLAAVADAHFQDGHAGALIEALVVPVEERLAEGRLAQSRQAAATRVDFFTLVRGED